MSIIVIGNCTVDLSFAVPRLPRPGETLLASGKTVDLGGKGANQAVVAARFGGRTILAAPVGNDADAAWATERLAAEGLSLDFILASPCPTDQSVIFVAPDGANSIVSTHEAAAGATPEWVEQVLERTASSGDVLLVQGNLRLATTHAALAGARSRQVTTILNPAPIQYPYDGLLPVTDVMILNEIEAVELGGHPDPIESGRALRAAGVPQVIVTLGEKGAILLHREGDSPVPAPAVAAIDTVGAGDAVCGALAAALAAGFPMTTALRIAVEAASLAVTRRGTQSSFPTRPEAQAILARYHDASSPLR